MFKSLCNRLRIEAFLTHLAVVDEVAASTQNQALSALLFLDRVVLQQELDRQIDALRAKRSRYLPTVLTQEEVKTIIQQLSGEYKLLIQLLYGSGLRLNEGLNFRVKDVDFSQKQIVIDVASQGETETKIICTQISQLMANLWCRQDAIGNRSTRD